LFGVSSVSYVAIFGQVMEKVVREAREHPDEQIVGVLLGGQSGPAIVVEDTATGPAESNSTHATLTGDSIAKIADDIISKRIRGSIVGWYHSHVRGGVFMSETDVDTQLKLQQFSPMVSAMVIDAKTGDSGFFRVDPKTKEAKSVRSETISGAAALPAAPPPAFQGAYPQPPAAGAPTPISTRTILVAVILITLAVTGGILALAYYRAPTAASLEISHIPPKPPFVIANPITFDANVTGTDLNNVTLAYRIIERSPSGKGLVVGDLVSVPMLLKAAGKDTYSYTIPASEISGVYVQYYISAFDGSGNVVRSDVYNLSVGDFDWSSDKTDEVVVARTIAGQARLDLEAINAFNKPVTIRVIGSPPAGVSIRPVSPQVVPPSPAVFQITSIKDSQLVQKYELEIDAVYSPPGASAVQIVRKATLVLTVTDFELDVSPNYLESQRGTDKEATYSLNMKIYDGFTVPNGFQISVTGLPEHTSWKLVLVDYRISEEELSEVSYNLVVKVESGAKTGLYLFAVKITAATAGGTISHDKSNIQLKIV